MTNPSDALAETQVPFIAHTVRRDYLFEDSRQLLAKVFPEWNADELAFKECKDGITNNLVQCTNRRTDLTVLIRAYGNHTEVIIDRSQELTNMKRLADLGMCPPLYARFNNGLVYGFIPGTVATPEEMGNDEWAPLIARQLAVWSQVSVPGDRQLGLFSSLRQWLSDVPQDYANVRANRIFHAHFSAAMLAQELQELERMLGTVDSPVVFAHNDLLSGNIVMSEARDRVSFIDYEYAMYNYRGFDIANHFNEYAGFECDYSRYPSKERQLRWFKVYLTQLQQDASAEALELMYAEVQVFRLASHYYWGVWGLVQASISEIDFDYMDYARMRFDEYFRIKQQLFG
ncbi:hypothetical protein IWW55_001256 [Coemansia sp. RSA 2706]|nr:hypothetical protein LPJ70_001167 [Coemansia sp. RSA 2708]KAJ2306849.1 hypothetical protein IWW55_001256 [Coemansia sp. RSA 2706]KAJ2734846.1 hypothetical protein H4R23_002331 [Coemansia sp. Cherry 401B]